VLIHLLRTATTWFSGDIKVVTALALVAAAIAVTFLFARVSSVLTATSVSRLSERRFVAASESGNHSFTILNSVRNRRGEIVDFRFDFINAAGAALMFDTPTNIIGKLYSERLPMHRRRDTFARYKEVADTGVPQQAEIHIATPDLDATWIRIYVCKLEDAVAITTTDISALKIAEAKLAEKIKHIEETTAHLTEIQILGRLGDWSFDFSKNTLLWSEEIYRIFDMEMGMSPLSVTEIAERIHPEDRGRLLAAIMQLLAGDVPENIFTRILRPSGGVRYMQGRAQRHLDADGRLARVTGTVIDVTEKIELHDALRASDARFANFMENSPALSFIKDREGRMLYMNASCMDMWGLEPNATGKTDADLWSPAIAVKLRVLDRMVLETDTPDSLIEILPVPGGGTCSLLTHKFPLHIPGGETLIGGVSIDITEQKAAEARALQALADRDVLLQEVHHRVKNNLQVICSLLGMQAAVSQDPRTVSAMRVSQDRVQSMAMIHELLYSAENAGDIDFSEYANRLMTELLMSYGITVSRVQPRFNIVPMRLGADRAILCGLIMNELITNSLKYAFPLQQEGVITISLAVAGENMLCMTVEDNGIGLPEGFSLENVHSLGLRVVQILTKQLDGSFRFESHEGTRVEVTFPVGDPAANHAPATVHPALQ
jgi:PAS domain S-box-containing protein